MLLGSAHCLAQVLHNIQNLQCLNYKCFMRCCPITNSACSLALLSSCPSTKTVCCEDEILFGEKIDGNEGFEPGSTKCDGFRTAAAKRKYEIAGNVLSFELARTLPDLLGLYGIRIYVQNVSPLLRTKTWSAS